MLSNRPLMARSRQQPLEHRLLLTATFCLLAGGAVMVYSASSARTLLEGHGDGTAYLLKYLMYGAIGLVVMQLLARYGLEHVRRITPAFLGVAAPGQPYRLNIANTHVAKSTSFAWNR